MNTKTERNWQLIVAGILFIIFGLVCAFFPGLTLASIAFIVGAAFVVSGVVNIATFIRDRDSPLRFCGSAALGYRRVRSGFRHI